MSIRVGSLSPPVPRHSLLDSPTFQAAEREVSDSLAAARGDHDADTATVLETWRGVIRVRRGHVAEALTDLELVMARTASAGVAPPIDALAGLLACHLSRGDLWRAGRSALPLQRAGDVDGIAGASAHHARGDLASAERDHAAAWQHYLDAGRALGPLVDSPAVLAWRLGAAVTAVHLGLRTDATALIETHRLLALDDGRPAVVAAALRAQAAISDPGARQEILQEALVEADPVDTPRLTAQVAVDLAAHLVLGGGSRERARSLLRTAEALVLTSGTAPLVERIGRLLILLGETPAVPPVTRADRLTGLQRLLAGHAVDGRSDEEIADALLLDVDLVRREVHESCRTLNIRVRHRIADALAMPPTT